MAVIEVSIPASALPLMPQPERTPAAVRAAVARLDPAALPLFDAEWTAALEQAREGHSPMPTQRITENEKWWLWAAVRRWPVLAARLHECELRSVEAASLAEARTSSAEIGKILRAAEAAE